jgi:hypothetical protein
MCAGFVGSGTACRAASCTGGTATAPGFCTGHGACEETVVSTCAPYACSGTKCGASCASDADCHESFRCDVGTGKCVSRDAASCDGMHTLIAPNGMAMTDCSPYTCAGATCNTTCVSVVDCVFPASCSPDHTCAAAATTTATNASGGCNAAGAHGDPDDLAAFVAVAALSLKRRRRRAAADA